MYLNLIVEGPELIHKFSRPLNVKNCEIGVLNLVLPSSLPKVDFLVLFCSAVEPGLPILVSATGKKNHVPTNMCYFPLMDNPALSDMKFRLQDEDGIGLPISKRMLLTLHIRPRHPNTMLL